MSQYELAGIQNNQLYLTVIFFYLVHPDDVFLQFYSRYLSFEHSSTRGVKGGLDRRGGIRGKRRREKEEKGEKKKKKGKNEEH